MQASAQTSTPQPAAPAGLPQILELRYYYLRNTTDNMRGRTTEFLRAAHMPALQKAGATATGAFTSSIAPGAPFILTVASFPSIAAYGTTMQSMKENAEYQKSLLAYNQAGLGYVRMQSSLLRGFPGFPGVVVPSAPASGSRLYELRRYESNSSTSLERKIRMFDEGETALFQKVGMVNVFFGETLVGDMMPNLVYMVGYDNMAAREKVWRDFVTSDEWKKMSTQPGVSDGEIVSNISASFLSPLPFSSIR